MDLDDTIIQHNNSDITQAQEEEVANTPQVQPSPPTPSVTTNDQASGSLSLSLLPPTPSVTNDDQASGSLSLSLLARGEPFVDEEQEYTTTDQVTQKATDGICIFAEWATTLQKREFVKMHAQLTQAQKDPIMSNQSTQTLSCFVWPSNR